MCTRTVYKCTVHVSISCANILLDSRKENWSVTEKMVYSARHALIIFNYSGSIRFSDSGPNVNTFRGMWLVT
jgi:hypothetical protein